MQSARNRAVVTAHSIALAAGMTMSCALNAPAANVQWTKDGNGSWTDAVNWSVNPALPGSGDDVTIDRSSGDWLVTLGNGIQSINSLFAAERLQFFGGTLNIATTAQINNACYLAGAKFAGGTWTFAPGTFTANSGILDNIALNGDLSFVGSNANLTLRNGLALNGQINLNAPSDVLGIDGTQTITGGTIRFGATESGPNQLRVYGSSSLTIAPGTTLSGGRAEIGPSGSNSNSLINQGLIHADRPGETLIVSAFTMLNEGTLKATNGSTLSVYSDGSWTNLGAVIADGGTVLLGGSFSLEGSYSLQAVNSGKVSLIGTLVNRGQELNLTSPEATLGFQSGIASGTPKISGGTVNISGGGSLIVRQDGGSAGSGTLEDVVLNGDMTIDQGNRLAVLSSLTLNGTMTFIDAAKLQLSGSLDGTGTFFFSGGNSAGTAPSASINALATTTIGSRVTVRGGGAGTTGSTFGTVYSNAQASTLLNQGHLLADLSGKTLAFTANHIINQGLVEATNGATLAFRPDGLTDWVNTGTIRADGGTVALGGKTNTASLGTLDGRNGQLVLCSEIENTGSTLSLNSSTGSVYLSYGSIYGGGRIHGGTISLSDGATVRLGSGLGFLDGVTINGPMHIDDTLGHLVISNGLTLNQPLTVNGAGTKLTFEGVQTLSNATLFFDGTSGGTRYLDSQVLTIGSTSLVHGGGLTIYTGQAASMVNQGTISADQSGKLLKIQVDNFSNQGTVEATNGGILQFFGSPLTPPSSPESGQERADPNGSFTNSGTISLGMSADFSVTGSFTQTASGRLALSLGGASPSSYSSLTVTGNTALAGTLELTLAGGFQPHWSDSFTLLTSGSLTGSFSANTLPTLSDSTLRWWTSITGGIVTAGVRNFADFNHDGTVNTPDLTLLLGQFGSSGSGLLADLDNNGLVNTADLTTFLGIFGSSASGAFGAVPAPATAVVVFFGAAPMLRRRRTV